jgi:hypothetical protein
MGAIVIKNHSKSLKLISELAKRLGSKVAKLDEEQLEDFTFGEMMKAEGTGDLESREMLQ